MTRNCFFPSLMTLQGIPTSIYTLYTIWYSSLFSRIANGVLDKVSPRMLSRNREMIDGWISGMNGVLDIMGHDAILKLFK